jgi:hypothetical protein
MKQKRTILLVLGIALVGSVVWAIFNYPRSKTVSRLKYPPGGKIIADKKRKVATQPSTKEIGADTLRLDLLEENLPVFTGYRKNIFQPIFVDKETMMARKAAAEAARAAAEAKKALLLRQAIKPPPQPSRMQRELASFTFKGFVLKDGRRTVFLSKGNEVLVLRQGDTFSGRYVAAAITDQMLKIKATDSGEEIIIPINR